MKALGLPGLAAGLAIAMLAAPVLAHDMGSMSPSDHSASTADGTAMGSHMAMGAHMVMTQSRPATPEDIARAQMVMHTLRDSISKYKNIDVATANGFVPFLPGVPQDVYHFTNFADAQREYSGHFDPTHPGSLLYVKHGDEYRLVGAMYSAPPYYTTKDLDALIPLSIGTWHVHTNICLPVGITLGDLIRNNVGADGPFMPGMIDPASGNMMADGLNKRLGVLADGRFGFHGKIADEAACKSAGGHFIKQAFGWMIHVYPFAGDDLKVAYSTDVPQS